MLWRGYDIEKRPFDVKAKDDRMIFRAWDTVNHRRVVVKRSTQIERIQHEAMVMKALASHENLVDFYDYVIEGEMASLVLEWIRGTRLKEWVERKGSMKPAMAVDLTVELLQGLSAVHKSGFIHRDVNPKNIIVTKGTANRPRLKLIDFGLAVPKGWDGVYRGTGWGFKKNPYRGPELAIHRIDDSYDVYSAAVVCLYMLTGKWSRRGINKINVRWLRKVLERAVQSEPKNRYRGAVEMAVALGH